MFATPTASSMGWSAQTAWCLVVATFVLGAESLTASLEGKVDVAGTYLDVSMGDDDALSVSTSSVDYAVDDERAANEVLYEVGEEVYQIERVLAYRADDDHYFIKWVGFPHSHNTWEPKGILPDKVVVAWMYSSESLESAKYENESGFVDYKEVNTTTLGRIDAALGVLLLTGPGLALVLMSTLLLSAALFRKTTIFFEWMDDSTILPISAGKQDFGLMAVTVEAKKQPAVPAGTLSLGEKTPALSHYSTVADPQNA